MYLKGILESGLHGNQSIFIRESCFDDVVKEKACIPTKTKLMGLSKSFHGLC